MARPDAPAIPLRVGTGGDEPWPGGRLLIGISSIVWARVLDSATAKKIRGNALQLAKTEGQR